MTRAVTLFTGQWADLPLEVLAPKAREWGYDGLELACWGDHFDVARALKEDGYCQSRRELLAKHDLEVPASRAGGPDNDTGLGPRPLSVRPEKPVVFEPAHEVRFLMLAGQLSRELRGRDLPASTWILS